jgi:hypothetical protein
MKLVLADTRIPNFANIFSIPKLDDSEEHVLETETTETSSRPGSSGPKFTVWEPFSIHSLQTFGTMQT